MKPTFMLFSALACAALWAEDFWQAKKFTEWDQKEVEKLLKNSPWCRTFSVEVRRGGGGGGARAADPNPGRGMGGGGIDGMGGRAGGGRGGRGGGGMGLPRSERPQQGNVSAAVLARWISALPVKQALARAQFGDEAAENPDARRSLEKQETQYVLLLIGLPRNLVRRGEQMKNAASLVVKGRDPIPAENARAEMRENGLMFVTLYFSKANHPLAPEDGDIAVQLKLPNQTITQKFKLKNMVFNGKLEI